MKGITPVIAVILLLLITIAMVGFAFVWFSRVAASAANATETALGAETSRMAKIIAIDNIDKANATVYVSNRGSQTIASAELALFVDNVQKNCAWSRASIAPRETASCNWGTPSCTGSTRVKVTGPGNFDEDLC